VSALDWRKKFGTPKLGHDSSGLVHAVLGERVIVFPCEASARFFVGACTELPNAAAENDTLCQMIDEKALHVAEARVRELEAERELLVAREHILESKLAEMAEAAAKSARRARVLALALKNGITP
jgi:hypothetical protein